MNITEAGRRKGHETFKKNIAMTQPAAYAIR